MYQSFPNYLSTQPLLYLKAPLGWPFHTSAKKASFLGKRFTLCSMTCYAPWRKFSDTALGWYGQYLSDTPALRVKCSLVGGTIAPDLFCLPFLMWNPQPTIQGKGKWAPSILSDTAPKVGSLPWVGAMSLCPTVG